MRQNVSARRRSSTRTGTVDPAELHRLFVKFDRTGDVRIRNQIVEAHLDLADHYTYRYGHHGLRDDIGQVARMAIVYAVDRFDPDRGVSFRTFASRTIDGECKRFLRDRSWNVRPPRALMERSLLVRRHQEELCHTLGRAPTVAELAHELEVSVEEVLEATEAYAVPARRLGRR